MQLRTIVMFGNELSKRFNDVKFGIITEGPSGGWSMKRTPLNEFNPFEHDTPREIIIKFDTPNDNMLNKDIS